MPVASSVSERRQREMPRKVLYAENRMSRAERHVLSSGCRVTRACFMTRGLR